MANIDVIERGRLFNQYTRQYKQVIGTKTASEGETVSFDLPKARLLAGAKLEIKATLTVTHASLTTYTPHEDSPFKLLNMLEINANNGFNPCRISGAGASLIMTLNNGVDVMTPKTSGRGVAVQPLVVSSGGTANAVRFFVDIPSVLNAKDPIGLILLANDETLVTVKATIGTKGDLCPAVSGFTVAISAITVTLVTETFSVPNDKNAMPDISVLKLTQEQTFTMIDGENTLKLPTGQIYRRIILALYSSAPARVADTAVTSNIQLVINQADIPYNESASMIAEENTLLYGNSLPSGIYVWDFATPCHNLQNLGSARDYIDSMSIQELWLRLTTSGVATAKIITETLSIMAGY